MLDLGCQDAGSLRTARFPSRENDTQTAAMSRFRMDCGLLFPMPILRQGSCAKIQAFSVGLEFCCVVARYRRSHAGKVYRRRFVSARLAAALLADGAPCFAICACPALVIRRDRSYISIHFSLEIAEISLPIASSGKSSGDSK